jgi:DNA-binding SARP family transcriptional activator
MQVRLLGPVDVMVDGGPRLVRGLRRKAALAALGLHGGEIVSTGRLVNAVWGETAPSTAVNTLQSHVSHLRNVLGSKAAILARPPGYLLDLGDDGTDVQLAERLLRQGTQSADPVLGTRHLQAAMALWRGRPLADLAGLAWLEEQAGRLDLLCVQVKRALFEARLAAGEHLQLVPDLERMAAGHPLDEQIHAQLMLALYRSGRQADALAVYHRLRRTLDEELGIDPSQMLRDLETAILRQDRALDTAIPRQDRALYSAIPRQDPALDAVPPATSRPAIDRLVPAQLPTDVQAFTGRAGELSDLDRLHSASDHLGETAGAPSAVVISVVSGTAGVGKTALAVRWAHQVRRQFPDGQLYINLRGYDPAQPVAPEDALAGFLLALGVAEQDIPLEVEARAAVYRTQTAGRRILILLDNAATVDQVRPLLPGTPSCLVVVTSRDSLAGLVARHGAHRLDLDLLPAEDATALLRALIGGRVDAEPGAAAALADQCARLPLALRVAAELAATRSALRLARLVAELADYQRRLDLLDAAVDARTAVSSVFSWSYQHLPADAARLFRLMSLHPGRDLDPYAAAALTGTTRDRAAQLLDLLARAHLIQPVGTGGGRYGMHDLLRAYASGLTTAHDPPEERREAKTRLFDHYLATAATAMDGLYPAETHRRPRIPGTSTPAPELGSPDTARAWLDTERPCLVAVAAHTADHGWPAHTVRLATILYRYLVAGHLTDALAIHTHACDAARQSGDRTAQAHPLHGLGTVHLRLGRYGPAAGCFEQALDLSRQAGDQVGQARALGNLGFVEVRLARHQPATEHFEEALDLFRQAEDQVGEAHALNALGGVEERLGRYGPATEHLQQGLDLSRQAGDQAGEADTLNSLGVVEVRLGRYEPAARHLHQALAVFRRCGDRTGEAWSLTNLGTLHSCLGRPGQAAAHHQQALTLFREIGERDGDVWALNGLGEAAHTAARPAEALSQHTAAHTIAVETGVRDQHARAHAGLAHAYLTLADSTRAREHYNHALALYTDLGMPDADQIRARLADLDQGAQGQRRAHKQTPGADLASQAS